MRRYPRCRRGAGYGWPPRSTDHPVWCPLCRRHYRAQVPYRWARAEARRLLSYPHLHCRVCQRCLDYARLFGGDPEQYRNPEQAPL